MRLLWTLGGVVFVVLALVGLALPVIPQVPFVIAAAYCFMKGSPRLYQKMLDNKQIGPIIRDWQRDGSVSRKTKWITTLSLLVAVVISVLLKLPSGWFALEVAIVVGVLVLVWTRPEPTHRPRPAGDAADT